MTSPAFDTLRREELAAFLKAKRAQMAPESVGLPTGARRRTQGLRREEIATLAGVSPVWYAWLEQARDIKPSQQLIERLARAFHLNEEEKGFLMRLALPNMRVEEPRVVLVVPPFIQPMLDSFTGCPAYVRNRRWDILAQNECYKQVYGQWREPGNVLKFLYLDTEFGRRTSNLDENRRLTLARFRTHYSEHPEDPAVVSLIEELTATSPAFKSHWAERKLESSLRRPIVFWQGHSAILEFEAQTLYPEIEHNLAVTIHLPRNQSTIDFIKRLDLKNLSQ